MDADEARAQRDQLDRFTRWAREEGTDELPVHIGTYMRPEQVLRLEWLKRWSQGVTLEVGCSWGYVLAYVNGSVGCDINPKLVELASIMAPERQFDLADARKLPYEDRQFDTVILAETIEHLPWIDGVVAAINEAKRVTERQVLVTIPNPAYEDSGATSFKHHWLATPPKQMELNLMLGPGVPVGPFLCYRKLV